MLFTILEIQWRHRIQDAGGTYVNLMVESPAIQSYWWLDQPQK